MLGSNELIVHHCVYRTAPGSARVCYKFIWWFSVSIVCCSLVNLISTWVIDSSTCVGRRGRETFLVSPRPTLSGLYKRQTGSLQQQKRGTCSIGQTGVAAPQRGRGAPPTRRRQSGALCGVEWRAGATPWSVISRLPRARDQVSRPGLSSRCKKQDASCKRITIIRSVLVTVLSSLFQIRDLCDTLLTFINKKIKQIPPSL